MGELAGRVVRPSPFLRMEHRLKVARAFTEKAAQAGSIL